MRQAAPATALAVLALLVAGCTGQPETRPGTSAPSPTPAATQVQPAGVPTDVVT